jgi:hypothetical protein
MNSPISPEFQYIIYKQREKELELAIQRRLESEARGENRPAKQAQPWYASAAGWLKANTLLRVFQKQAVNEPVCCE